MRVLPKIVLNKYVTCFLLFGLGAGLGLATVSVYNIPREELYSIYYKDGSAIGEFYDARRHDFPFPVILQIVFDKQIDYSDIETRQILQDFFRDINETLLFEENSV